MQTGYLITGTDTGVGKTVVAAGIAGALVRQGYNVGVMKPVGTGGADLGGVVASLDAVYLQKVAGVTDDSDLVNPYCYVAPVAPSVAARVEDVGEVDLKRIEDRYFQLTLMHEIVIVEGIGGLLCPLNRQETVLDLGLALGIEAIVVARPSLGTISQTLLTVNYARSMGLNVAGIVINGFGRERIGLAERTNPEEIERFTQAPVLGILPWMDGVCVEEGSSTGLVDSVLARLDLDALTADDAPGWDAGYV